jgi:lipopolysaccharide export system permease protein|tara:strand:+ start:495 stop:1553 length:1059 start_codon:yes stop_codon:yes gene_type:complete
MKILDTYISKSVLTSSFIVLFALVGIFTFFAFIGDLSDSEGANTKIIDIILTSTLGIPELAYQVMPLAALIGSLLALGGMMEAHELVVIRVAGATKIRVLQVVIKTSVLLMLAALLLGEFVAPLAQTKIHELSFKSDRGLGPANNKIWIQDLSAFVSIKAILPDCRMVGVNILELGADGKLSKSIYADEASCSSEGWILKKVKQTDFKGDAYDNSYVESRVWPTELDFNLLGLLGLEPQKLTLKELSLYLRFADEDAGDFQQWSQAFWTRIVHPLSIMLMTFLSFTVALSVSRSSSVGGSVLAGGAIGLVFYVLNELVGNFGLVFNINSALAAVLPSLLVLFLTGWLFRRIP